MRVMRIYCPECDEVAVIKKTNRKHAHISDVYCACSNVECGHTFVMNMTFSHTLSPSAISHGHLIKELIGSIAEDKRQEMIDMLRMVQNDDSKAQINEKPTGQPSPSRYRRGG
ncbi:hypothetical protein M2371_000181 [Buttiauxella sp. BIGb0471]|uniref:ogr/Delta-like zinc finger family protein n=1 Tax=Buttiauxella sp. BIGb0471 TaxID=2940597 RepID=UPI0021680EF2|nr:ogr/Delta-like zinc finger family protein [Buttiauxella sp. BIGb0471]MCS3600995.1 hypothetical protein [Buttiauxella sp. BIGb0471]